MTYDPESTLAGARAAYFAANDMAADGGYDDEWVRIQIGPIPYRFRNSETRKRIVPLHDLHHVLTGYGTDLRGEAEVGAWEIASGMRNFTGMQLDLRVMGFVLPMAPGRVMRAFVRGRYSRNLMDGSWEDAKLAHTVGATRTELGLDLPAPAPRVTDRLAFGAWSALALAIVWGPLVLLGAGGWWLLA